MAKAEGIVQSEDSNLLAKNGGTIVLSPHKWSGHKWSGGTIYVRHNWSGWITYVVINGPPGPLMPKHKWSY